MRIGSMLFIAAIELASMLPLAHAQRPERWSTTEWRLPTRDSLPHDVASAPDGSLWYTAERANKVGQVDVMTGKMREFSLPTEDSGPHGLVVDRMGRVWYTANHKGLIGKLDPTSGQVVEYRIQDSRGRDPHTPVFDQKGILWFTVQNGNAIGRLDPQSAKITLIDVPTANAKPYGIVVTSYGVPYFCEFGSNQLASIDPRTLKITEYRLPNSDTRPRRLALTATDAIYFTDYARGFLGYFDPRTGRYMEWPAPSGKASRPYAIAVNRDGLVWYSESGVRPNTMVRFDPATDEFVVQPIPGGGGVVRNMVAAPDGRLYMAESGVNTVAMIQPSP